MGFMFKTLLIIVAIGVLGSIIINNIPSFKNKIIETINPRVKENRLIGEIKNNLDELDRTLAEAVKAGNSAGAKNAISKGAELLSSTKSLLNEVRQTNNDTGILSSAIGKIVDLFNDKTPFPADHIKTNQNIPVQTQSCPTPAAVE